MKTKLSILALFIAFSLSAQVQNFNTQVRFKNVQKHDLADSTRVAVLDESGMLKSVSVDSIGGNVDLSNYMTKNSSNFVTGDWSLTNIFDASIKTFRQGFVGSTPNANLGENINWVAGINGFSYADEIENSSVFLSSSSLKFSDYSGLLDGAELRRNGAESILHFPNSGLTPRVLPISINGIFADVTGNIELGAVSSTESGIVNNTALQELGGVDKLINGIRVGRGNGNDVSSVALGFESLLNSTSGAVENVAVGNQSLKSLTSGDYNVAVGASAMGSSTTGSRNVGVGTAALFSNTTGQYNSALGDSTLPYNTTGSRNVAVGTSLFYNSTGQRNTGVGFNAGYGATTGQQNTYIGNQSGYNNGVGSYNTAIGSRAMITTGGGTSASSLDMNNNVFIGAGLTLADAINNVLAIDNKGATNTVYSSALLYGNFADRFLKVNGRFEIAPLTMPTADVDFTKKLVWNPTTGVVGIADDSSTSGFMTLNSNNSITNDFGITDSSGGIFQFGKSGLGNQYLKYTMNNGSSLILRNGNILFDMGIQDRQAQIIVPTISGGISNESNVFLPYTAEGTDAVLTLSVNGIFADVNGNIELESSNSYSTTETPTGGTWIDGKPIYRIVKLIADPDPSDIETRLPDQIVGSYSILEYTKTTD